MNKLFIKFLFISDTKKGISENSIFFSLEANVINNISDQILNIKLNYK